MNADRARPDPRSERSRRALVDAGVELLADAGWAGLTTRAIAERAQVNHGLVHYYFGDLDNLRLSIASAVIERSLQSVVDELVTTDDWVSAAAGFVAHDDRWSNSPESRQVAELKAAALREPKVRALTAAALADARRKTAAWLANQGVVDAAPLATILVAMLDGLVLHRLVDERLDLAEVAQVIGQLRFETDTARGSDDPD